MSLQTALKETRERLGTVQTQAREIGLALTEAELKGDAAVAATKKEAFEKAMKDVETLMASAQRTESLIAAEAKANEVVNGLPNDPAEAYRDEGKAERGVVSKETAERFQNGIRECQNAYFRHGEASPEYVSAKTKLAAQTMSLKPDERQALVGNIGTLGGALVTEDFKSEVVKNMAGFSVALSSGVRVVPCSSNTLVFPSIAAGTDPWSTGFSGAWRPAGSVGTDGTAPAVQNQPTFGTERIPVHEWQPDAIVVDPSLLEDAAVPLESILQEAIAETQAMDWDYAFLRGNGIGQPRGIHDYIGAGVTAVKSGSASAVTYNGLIDLMYTLPAQYREGSVWYMKSLTFGAVLQLKDSSQMPIIYSGSVPGTLFGKKVWMTEHMPAIAGAAHPILFGNPRFYVVASRRDLRVQRLVERFAPNVAFLPTARVGGGLVRPVAFVAQSIAS
jgi:HK97 family phage major capsid protein